MNGFYNQEGYADPTAYNGIKLASADDAIQNKANFLIKVLKYIIRESGFELIGRIELRDRRSGQEFR